MSEETLVQSPKSLIHDSRRLVELGNVKVIVFTTKKANGFEAMSVFADKIERPAGQSGLMYSDVRFNNQISTGSTDETSVCSTV